MRAFQCLSLGTPVISERRAQTQVPEAFERAVQWLGDDELEDFFVRRFATPDCYRSARDQLEAFAATDPVDDYAELMAFAAGFHQAWGETRRKEVWRPRHINLGSGKDYKAGWLNVDVVERSQPDWLLDLSQPHGLAGRRRRTRCGERFLLEAGSVEQVYANNVLEHVPDLVR